MAIIKSKCEAKENEYEIKEQVAYIKVRKKDGTIVDAKIDAEDLEKVLAKGVWFAEWHKDFNNYLVQNLDGYCVDGEMKKGKQSLQTLIMNVHPKAPVRHCNGDTLDNRKSNLDIFNQKSINDYKAVDKETVAVILRDKYGKEKATTLVDKEDLNRVINHGYSWVYYRHDEKPYAVANTTEGRVYLNRYIMNTPEDMVTHPINLNTLDNRKCNLENVSLSEEE